MNFPVTQSPRLGFPWTLSLLPLWRMTGCKGCCLCSLPLSLKSQLHRLPLDKMTTLPRHGASCSLGFGTPMGGRTPELVWDYRNLIFIRIVTISPGSWFCCVCEDQGPVNSSRLVSCKALTDPRFGADWCTQEGIWLCCKQPSSDNPSKQWDGWNPWQW